MFVLVYLQIINDSINLSLIFARFLLLRLIFVPIFLTQLHELTSFGIDIPGNVNFSSNHEQIHLKIRVFLQLFIPIVEINAENIFSCSFCSFCQELETIVEDVVISLEIELKPYVFLNDFQLLHIESHQFLVEIILITAIHALEFILEIVDVLPYDNDERSLVS